MSGSSDKSIKVWNREGECITTIRGHLKCVQCLTQLDSLEVVSGSADKTLKVWNRGWECIKTLKGHTGHVLCVL